MSEFDDYFRSQGLVLNPEGTEYIKPDSGSTEVLPELTVTPEDNDLEKKKRALVDKLARQVLTEEAITGQPSGTREVLSQIDRLGTPDAEVQQAQEQEDTSDKTDPVAAALPEPAPVQTVQDIQVQNQPGPDPAQFRALLGHDLPDPSQVNQPEPSTIEQLKALSDTSMPPVRQFMAKAAGNVSALPHELLATAITPFTPGMQGNDLTEGLRRTGALAREGSRQFFEANATPQGPVEQLAGLVGDNLTPVKGMGVVKPTAAMTAANLAIDNFVNPAEAAQSPEAKARAAQRKVEKAAVKRLAVEAAAEHTVETIGGPAKVQGSEFATIGGMAAITIGAIFAPTLFKRFVKGAVPKLRPVNSAAPGTMAMSTPTDLARTYDDVNAGALRLARRAGIDPQTMQRLEDTFQIQTRAGARSIANSAVTIGHAETPGFVFRSKVPLAALAQAETPQVSQYLHLRDTIDDLLLAQTKQSTLSTQKQAMAGTPKIRGYTLPDALTELGQLERANPNLKAISKAYQDNIKAVRKFQNVGEYGTLSKKQMAEENATRSNYVQFKGERQYGDPLDRGSAVQSAADYVQQALRHRMENEAVGMYVDNVRKVQPDLFKRVSHKELKDNPTWKDNVVRFYRRGKLEMYTTDPFLADVLKLDPYFMTSTAQNIVFSTKRALEIGSTGALAPWFAITSMLRSHQISKYTAGVYNNRNLKSSTLIGSLYAIPQQLLPQMAKAISQSLDTGSAGYLKRIFPQGVLDGLSLRLAKAFDESLFAKMQSVGTTHGSILQQQTAAQNRLKTAISQMNGNMKTVYNGYQALLQAVHNAPAFNFTKRNLSRVPDKATLAMLARDLTGDPRIGGQYFRGAGGAIRFEKDTAKLPFTNIDLPASVTHTMTKGVKAYGLATEFGREVIPWFNVTTQGMKRIGQAYIENPAKFTGRAWLYASMPAASTYFLARSLDKDPNGNSYVDYMMNRRSAYNKLMNYYIPIPGLPAEYGIEFPRFHELTPVAHMTEVALDHMFRSSIFKESEDFAKARDAFISAALMPPLPPAFAVHDATHGIVAPQGAFGGEAYTKKTDPFDQTGGLPASVELVTRALAGGIADVAGSGIAAFVQPEQTVTERFQHALQESGKKVASKTPLVRNMLGVTPPISGNTDISGELFDKNKEINQLVNYLNKTSAKEISTKPQSAFGGVVAEKLLGKHVPEQLVGLTQPDATNPLYIMFSKEVYDKFKRDAPSDKGQGIGFQSLWRRYGDATAQLKSMKNINAGNYVTWQKQLEQRSDQMIYLEENKVNYKDPVAVRNFYERVRQDAAKAILFTIRAVENEFSQRIGQPITLKDLDPYGKGITPKATTVTTPSTNDYTGANP